LAEISKKLEIGYFSGSMVFTGLLMEQLVSFAFEQNKNSDPNQDKWHNLMTVAS
jgi:hypothetical protein